MAVWQYKNFTVKKDTIVQLIGGVSYGAGKDDSNALGYGGSPAGWARTALMATFPDGSFEGWTQVNRIWLYAHTRSFDRVSSPSGTPTAKVRRVTKQWSEGNAAGHASSEPTKWPGPTVETTDQLSSLAWLQEDGSAYSASGVWVRILITPLGMWWLPVECKSPNGSTRGSVKENNGLLLASQADDWTATPSGTSTANNAEFHTAETNHEPYLRFEYTTNHLPGVPKVTFPSPFPVGTDETPTPLLSKYGDLISVTHQIQDADLGATAQPGPATDYLSAFDFALYDNVATDLQITQGTAGDSLIRMRHETTNTTTAREWEEGNFPVPRAWVGAPMQLTIRDYDKSGQPGPWLPLHWVVSDCRPWVLPPDVTFDHYDRTPSITIRLRSNVASATLAAVRTIIRRKLANGTYRVLADVWQDVPGGGRTATVDPGLPGEGLDFGIPVELYVQVRNQWGTTSLGPDETPGDPSEVLGEWIRWTPVQITGPSNVHPPDGTAPPTLAYRHRSRRPTFTIGHTEQWDQYEERWNDAVSEDGSALAGNVLWASGIVNASPSHPGTWDLDVQYPASGTAGVVDLSWGATPWFQVRVHLVDGWTDWSSPYPARINALPDPVQWLLERTDGTWQLLDGLAIFTSESLTPYFRAPYVDVDEARDGDYPTITDWLAQLQDGTIVERLVRAWDDAGAFTDVRFHHLDVFEQPGAQDVATAGWTAGAGTHVLDWDATTKTDGNRALKVAITAQALSTTVRDLGPDLFSGTLYSDVSGPTGFTCDVRIDGTITNLSSLRLRFHWGADDTSNFSDYQLATSATATGAFATVTKAWSDTVAQTGTRMLSQLRRVSVVAITGGGGTLTATAYVDNLVLTDVFTAQTVYVLSGRIKDDNTADPGFNSPGVALFRASAAPTPAWGTLPDGTDPTPDIAYTYNGTADQASRELVLYRRRGLSDLLAHRPGALLFWPLNEPDGSTAADGSGNSRTGTISAGVALAQAGITGDGSTAFEMDAAGEKVSIADASALRPASFSFFALLRLASLADTAYLVRKVDAGNGSWFLRTGTGGATHRQLTVAFQTSAGVYQTLGLWPAAGTDPTLSQWLFVAFGYDGSSKATTFWVGQVGVDPAPVQYDNAGAIATAAVVANAAPFSSSPGNLEVGAVSAALTVRHQMFALINRATDATEVAAVYAEVLNGATDEVIYVETEDDVEADGTAITISVPGHTVPDDATVWPQVTVIDANDLATVLA